MKIIIKLVSETYNGTFRNILIPSEVRSAPGEEKERYML